MLSKQMSELMSKMKALEQKLESQQESLQKQNLSATGQTYSPVDRSQFQTGRGAGYRRGQWRGNSYGRGFECGWVVRWCWVNFQCPGVLLIWLIVGQGPTALAVGASGGCLYIFTLIYLFSSLSPSLWDRLKYCLKGPLNPKQPTNRGFNNKGTYQYNSRPGYKCGGSKGGFRGGFNGHGANQGDNSSGANQPLY